MNEKFRNVDGLNPDDRGPEDYEAIIAEAEARAAIQEADNEERRYNPWIDGYEPEQY